MERRGIYRKGSCGHSRNINPYLLWRQRIKKWRIPLTVFLALILVFGTAPVVGEDLEASLLTAEQANTISNEPEQFRKALLSALKSFVDECKKFEVKECVRQGELLLNQIVITQDIGKYIDAATDFHAQFEKEVIANACRYGLQKAFVQAKAAENLLKSFIEKYGDYLEPSQFSTAEEYAAKTAAALQEVVDFCKEQLVQ